ncbi:hypothetical protein D7X96_15985 [Corallococcus interemptor]|uniref:Uncharacterized protein n=1 Tax=Corallococcus interemptor TaxID=2316720 RepID=A0A3A8QMM6_9BACT|nr:hypothetical protein D7X96_15985 [Corallococcus interemptor]
MNMEQRVALAWRLGKAEAELQEAVRGLDGSPASRTRYAQAREEHRRAERLALVVLGAQEASSHVEQVPAT